MSSKMPCIVRIVQDAPHEAFETSDGKIHTGPGGCYAAARHLIGLGFDPKKRMVVMRNNSVSLSGTIDAFARLAWGGTKSDPFPRKWAPFGLGGGVDDMPAPLAAWWRRVGGG